MQFWKTRQSLRMPLLVCRPEAPNGPNGPRDGSKEALLLEGR